MQVKTGSFVAPSSTGTFSVTGVGFTPKLLIIFSVGATANDTEVAAIVEMHGATDGTTTFSTHLRVNSTATPFRTDSTQSATNIVWMTDSAGTATHKAAFTSFDSDGFTLNFTTATTANLIFKYYCLSGSDLQVKIKAFDAPASTGSQAVTGIGFQPTTVMHYSAILNSASVDTAVATARLSRGFVTADSNKCALSEYYDDNNPGTTDPNREMNNDDFCNVVGAAAATSMRATFTSFDADGFTINWATVLGTTRRFYAVCLGGVTSASTQFSDRNGTGTLSVTGVSSFVPKFGILMGINAFNETPQAYYAGFYSVISGSTSQELIALCGSPTGTTGNTFRRCSSAKAIDHAMFLTSESAAFTGFNSTGADFNYVQQDGFIRQIGMMLLGNGTGAGGSNLLLGVG